MKSDNPISNWLLKHGDGIVDVGINVDDAEEAYKSCISRGAISAYQYKP